MNTCGDGDVRLIALGLAGEDDDERDDAMLSIVVSVYMLQFIQRRKQSTPTLLTCIVCLPCPCIRDTSYHEVLATYGGSSDIPAAESLTHLPSIHRSIQPPTLFSSILMHHKTMYQLPMESSDNILNNPPILELFTIPF